jgi:hypothetical protein
MDPIFDVIEQLEPPTTGSSQQVGDRQRQALNRWTASGPSRRWRRCAGGGALKALILGGKVGVVALSGGGLAAGALRSLPLPPIPQAAALYNHDSLDSEADRALLRPPAF